MLKFIEKLLDAALSEYGLLVALLLVLVYMLWKKAENLQDRNDTLTDKTIEALNNNTKVLTEVRLLAGKGL